ncbi:VOC family protein [Kitasatospora sp. GAS204B]|uniref:VOC family protein n=1 Tax=unclassified Kitasatospora TaxID=2633591 RepID=UPI0024737006|nr:VOC family protein [Kitasatospora sp. GAS204B]MDH6120686.1 catechol 2,3-dioxygenase-like lactoylglutathione lyase family enzyme [Kitasatospora sp. GAS204B]
MGMSLRNVTAITLFVEDLERSREFYRTVCGLDPMYEDADSAAFKFDNTIINLLKTTAADEVVAPSPVAAAGLGARCLYTISVDDTDEAVARLAELGVPVLGGPIDRPWGLRTAAFADPDGNVWEVAQELPSVAN